MFHPNYIIDFETLLQFHCKHTDKQRPVKRGQPGERNRRPSQLRFSNAQDFTIGQFKPTGKWDPSSGGYPSSDWLGEQFYIKNGKKFPTIQQVKEGLMAFQRVRSLQSVKEAEPGNEQIQSLRAQMVQAQTDAWALMFDQLPNISDQDILDITLGKHTASSDGLAELVLYIYTMESDVYPELNRANQWHDESLIQTLGPLAWVLNFVLLGRGTENTDLSILMATEKSGELTVYRGLGMPKSAIEDYSAKFESQELFCFTGYTSTSLDQTKALEFSYKGLANGQVPVLFEMVSNRVYS